MAKTGYFRRFDIGLFCKNTLTIIPIIFYGTVIIRHTFEEREYIRPILSLFMIIMKNIF